MMLTQEQLKEMMHYDLETGVFTWRTKPSKRIGVGAIAGCVAAPLGYLQIGVMGVLYYGHRLAWLYMIGAWPKEQIDHINGIRHDNKFNNLREASNTINSQNIRNTSKHNKTGFLGVFSHRKRFSSQIVVDGNTICLGDYDTPQLAHEAYISAKRKLHPGCTI